MVFWQTDDEFFEIHFKKLIKPSVWHIYQLNVSAGTGKLQEAPDEKKDTISSMKT